MDLKDHIEKRIRIERRQNLREKMKRLEQRQEKNRERLYGKGKHETKKT